MTELVRRATGVIDPAEATRLSRSKLVPEHIAGDGASAEYMMRFGAALGIDPMSSFQHIFVFPDGKGRLKAGMSAHLMHALAVAAGHTVHVEGNAIKATSILVRKTSNEQLQRFQAMREEERRQKFGQMEDLDRLYKMQRGQLKERIEDLQAIAAMDEDPVLGRIQALLASNEKPSIDEVKALLAVERDSTASEELKALRKQLADLHGQYDFQALREEVSTTKFDLSKLVRFESTWTLARAQGIPGLLEKSTWKNYRPEMLKSRAKSGVVRDGAIDVILGIRNILGEMGLLLSDDDHDNLAVANAAYTPEELGADVDENERPLVGEVINVTEAKASKRQAQLADWAEKIVGKADAERIVSWAVSVPDNKTLSTDDKISRLYAIQSAANEAEKGETVVAVGDVELPLTNHLDSIISSLR